MEYSIPIFLAFVLLSAPPAAQAQFSYATNDGTITLSGYTGSGGAVLLSNFVTSIGSNAFYNCGNLTNVTIPASVTSIGDSAFFSCSSLASATIPDSVTNIGDLAFCYCFSITNISIGIGVTSIGKGIFYENSSLTSVTIPNTVTSIGEWPFSSCGSLTNVTFGDSLVGIGVAAFDSCGTLTSVTIPNSVTGIGESAFDSCSSLTNVTIGTGLNYIDMTAFSSCNKLNGVHFAGNLSGVYFQGNPPAVVGDSYDGPVFYEDNAPTAYYLPGTTGWSNTYQGIPAVLWNPLIQTGNGNFGVQNNQFGFDITGTAGIPIVVEACTNLANPVWTALTNVSLTSGQFYFSEPLQADSPGRYYRISSP
jgi:hypothetical protein